MKQIYGDEVVLTLTQRKTLEEFVRVLEPFLESTLLLQKEAFSIGHVLPSIRGENLILSKIIKYIKNYKIYLTKKEF